MPPVTKRILCYGDSNTWGYIPGSGNRYKESERWPGVLNELLGPETTVFEEGLNGRTTCFDDGFFSSKNGLKSLPKILKHHSPLDLVIVALGINDLKVHLQNSVSDAAAGAEKLIAYIQDSNCGRSGTAPAALLVSPPPVAVSPQKTSEKFVQAVEQSKQFATEYRIVSERSNALFLCGQDTIQASSIDGIHYDVDQHRKLAEAVAKLLSSYDMR